MKFSKKVMAFWLTIVSAATAFFPGAADASKIDLISGRQGISRQEMKGLQRQVPSLFIYDLKPGDVARGVVSVVNLSRDKTLSAFVYGADRAPVHGTGFALKLRTQEMIAMGKWVELEQTQVTLPPRGKQLIPFTITIPKGAHPKDMSGGVVIETISEDIAPENVGGIRLKSRTGIRIYAHVATYSPPLVRLYNKMNSK